MSGGATLDNQLALARISYFVSSISFQNLYYYEAMIDLISVNCYVLFLHALLSLVLADLSSLTVKYENSGCIKAGFRSSLYI